MRVSGLPISSTAPRLAKLQAPNAGPRTTMTLVVVFEFQVKPDAIEATKAFLRQTLPETRRYAGCESVEVYNQTDDPAVFVFLENWQSREHYDKYMAWRVETGTLSAFAANLVRAPTFRYMQGLEL